MKHLILIGLVMLCACYSSENNDSNENSNNTNVVNTGSNDNDIADVPVTCSEKGEPIEDGPEGFTWKPISESDGLPVVLFPARFFQKFLHVDVYKIDGSFERGEFAGFTNGARQTFRFTSDPATFSGKIEADATTAKCVWIVPDPTVRQD